MLLIDIFEPVQVRELLSQSVEVSQIPLNQQGYADYHWTAVDGHTIQVERKQIDEILGGLDHVEEQLSREVVKADETILVCEGLAEHYHDAIPSVRSWRMAKTGRVMVPHHTYHMSYAGLEAWLYQLDKAGISTFHTFDYICTARALVAWYNSTQVAEHSTLRRYIKDRVYIPRSQERINPGARNPHILNLMNIKGGGVGEETARALVERFGTFWYTITQEPGVLAETIIGRRKFGESGARKLLRSIGRLQ